MTLLVDKNRPYRRWKYTPAEKIQLANNGLQWVLSSNVSAVGVDDNDLIIRFHNGSMYRYFGQGELFQPMMKSNSKGHYVWVKLRKPKARYQKIGSLPFTDDVEVSDDDIMSLIENEGRRVEERLRAFGMFIPNQSNPLDLIGLNALMNTL